MKNSFSQFFFISVLNANIEENRKNQHHFAYYCSIYVNYFHIYMLNNSILVRYKLLLSGGGGGGGESKAYIVVFFLKEL